MLLQYTEYTVFTPNHWDIYKATGSITGYQTETQGPVVYSSLLGFMLDSVL